MIAFVTNTGMQPGGNSVVLPDDEWQYAIQGPISLAVCIPAYAEPALIRTLESLASCEHQQGTGVFVVLNAPESAGDEIRQFHQQQFHEIRDYAVIRKFPYSLWTGNFSHLPVRKAGVGMARKLAMDKAAGMAAKNAVLLCLDADCTVSSNYLQETVQWFDKHPKVQAASLYFEHSDPSDPVMKAGIRLYELHLRYLKHCLKWAGYPWYFHTVGSSMAVRARTYLNNGGMNSRQAGEDFYFLHKLMPLGFGEINGATVYPEARLSHRVPFGTGRSMSEFAETGEIFTYAPETFRDLKELYTTFDSEGMSGVLKKSNENPVIRHFIADGMEAGWEGSLEHSSGTPAAVRRFHKWFSGFRMVRCLNAIRDVYPDIPVESAAMKMMRWQGIHIPVPDLPEYYRKLDRYG